MWKTITKSGIWLGPEASKAKKNYWILVSQVSCGDPGWTYLKQLFPSESENWREETTFRQSWKRRNGASPYIFLAFLCSGLEQTIWAPNQSFLMKKVKIYRNQWHSAISWKRRNAIFRKMAFRNAECYFPPLSAALRHFPPFRLFQDPPLGYPDNLISSQYEQGKLFGMRMGFSWLLKAWYTWAMPGEVNVSTPVQ